MLGNQYFLQFAFCQILILIRNETIKDSKKLTCNKNSYFPWPRLNPTNKKSQKILWISDQIFGFWILWSYQNSWILFSEIWPASCTKKLDPIFFRFIQKNLRVQNFQIYPEKKLDLRIFVGRIKPREDISNIYIDRVRLNHQT